MAKSDETSAVEMIRFRCPQCTRSWKVDARHTGKKFRCPACFMERKIPDANTKEPTVTPHYDVDAEQDTQKIILKQTHIPFRCRICRASLAATSDQVGQTLVCPDCDTANVVPEPKPKDENKEPVAPIDIYGVAGFGHGADLPPDDTFPVYCSICHALIYARDEQIGTTLQCPDCDSDIFVHGRPEEPVKVKHVPKVYEGSSTYELLAENQLPPDTQLVPVICSLCYTRMYATVDQIGQEKECPDCGKMNPIKPVPPEFLKTVAELYISPAGAYGIGEITQRPKMRVNVDYRTVEGAVVESGPTPSDEVYVDPAEMAERIQENLKRKRLAETQRARRKEDDEDELTRAEKLEARAKKRSQGIGVVTYRRAQLPKRPLTQGYWKLFRYMATYVHATLAMLFFLLAAPVAVILINEYSPNVEQLAGGSPMTVTIYMFMGLYVYTMVFAGLCYLSQISLAVGMSTANGADEVDDWGGFSPFGALWSLICVGGAVAIGWTPAILWNACLSMTQSQGSVPGSIMLICLPMSFLLFPVMLLRFLEGFEKHVIKSRAVWSLRLIPGIWLRFYLLGIPCLIVPALILWRLFYSQSTGMKTFCSFGLAIFLPFCAICYFRLFGRLAWAVETAVGKKLQELEDLAAAEEDDDWDDEPEKHSYDSRIDLPDHAMRD